ncbi:HNH endonuclease [Bowdeniella nasicola]|nr:HNH endonuclease [Bowdeniella nasicola]
MSAVAPITYAEFTAARELLARAASAGIAMQSKQTKLALTREILALERSVATAKLRILAAADAAKAARSEGHDVADVLAEFEHLPTRECEGIVLGAHRSMRHPELLEAYRSGRISRANRVTAEFTIDHLRPLIADATELASIQTALIADAQRLTPTYFQRHAEALKHRYDGEAAKRSKAERAKRARAAHERRGVRMSQHGPAFRLGLDHTAAAGDIITEALGRRARTRRAARLNARAPGAAVPLRQRLADALLELCREDNARYPSARELLSDPNPNATSEATGPHPATAGTRPAADGPHPAAASATADLPEHPSPRQLRAFVQARYRGQFDLGRTKRLADERLRTIVNARDGGCVYPGCTTHAALCEIAHITSWRDGGPTDLTNLATLCPHHHWITEHPVGDPERYSITVSADGLPAIIPPIRVDARQRPIFHERFGPTSSPAPSPKHSSHSGSPSRAGHADPTSAALADRTELALIGRAELAERAERAAEGALRALERREASSSHRHTTHRDPGPTQPLGHEPAPTQPLRHAPEPTQAPDMTQAPGPAPAQSPIPDSSPPRSSSRSSIPSRRGEFTSAPRNSAPAGPAREHIPHANPPAGQSPPANPPPTHAPARPPPSPAISSSTPSHQMLATPPPEAAPPTQAAPLLQAASPPEVVPPPQAAPQLAPRCSPP